MERMMTKKTDEQARAEERTEVSGFQEGIHYPTMPRTPEEFAQLLDNPDKPAEYQSAPAPEKLNPHLFPERLP